MLNNVLIADQEEHLSQSLLPGDVFLAAAFTPFIFLLAAAVPCAFLEYKTNLLCMALKDYETECCNN